MQFNPIGGYTRLPVQEVEHGNSPYLDRHVDGLEIRTGRKLSRELGMGIGDSGCKWAAGSDTSRVGNFGDHGISRTIDQNQVNVLITLQFEFSESGVDCPDGSFGGLDSARGRYRIGRGERSQAAYRTGGAGIEVYQGGVAVATGLDLPALNPAGARQTRRHQQYGKQTHKKKSTHVVSTTLAFGPPLLIPRAPRQL